MNFLFVVSLLFSYSASLSRDFPAVFFPLAPHQTMTVRKNANSASAGNKKPWNALEWLRHQDTIEYTSFLFEIYFFFSDSMGITHDFIFPIASQHHQVLYSKEKKDRTVLLYQWDTRKFNCAAVVLFSLSLHFVFHYRTIEVALRYLGQTRNNLAVLDNWIYALG